jgi:hypothetical protein
MMVSAKARAAALVAAGVVGGGVLAGTLSATAATGTGTGTGAGATSSASSSTSSSTPAPPAGVPGARGMGPGGAQPVRSDEKLVTGADAATLKAAALKAVSGGTVIRVETDAGDGAYEAHMKKADGSLVTVKFDKNLKVTSVEDGMGKGDPAPAGAPTTSG